MSLINENDNERVVGGKLSELARSVHPEKAFAERLLRAVPDVSVPTRTTPLEKVGMAPWLRAALLVPAALALLVFMRVENMNADPIFDIMALEVEASEIDQDLDLDYETFNVETETEMDLVEMDPFEDEL